MKRSLKPIGHSFLGASLCGLFMFYLGAVANFGVSNLPSVIGKLLPDVLGVTVGLGMLAYVTQARGCAVSIISGIATLVSFFASDAAADDLGAPIGVVPLEAYLKGIPIGIASGVILLLCLVGVQWWLRRSRQPPEPPSTP